MKIFYALAAAALFCFSSTDSSAQEEEEERFIRGDSKEFANPSVIGENKSKGLIIRYEALPDFRITSTSPNNFVPGSTAEVRRNNRFEVKAYAPLWNRPHLKMVLGFNYGFEEFNFETPDTISYDFYENLEDKNLKNIGAQLVVLRPVNYKNYYVIRLKGQLNGDYTRRHRVDLHHYLRSTMEFLYGWKKSPMLSWGVGAQIGYTFGRRSIYPAILYNRAFNKNWGVNAVFPANVMFRYSRTPRSYWYAGYELGGDSYNINIDSPPFRDIAIMELRKTEIRGVLRWEREIYDFLWFGMETGYRYNYRFRAFEGVNRRGDPLLENKLKGAVFGRVELFLVPPRRLLKQ